MKYARIICRILLGLVFIFSGFVKGIDPMGSAIKFTEYFEVFHLSWLESAALILAVVLSTAEFLIGVALVIGLRMRVTAWAALLFMSFFTAITLFIAIKNPVTDCGCFGDAIKITNWQTFYKNIVLIIIAIFIFGMRNKYKPYAHAFVEWLLVAGFAAVGVGISMFCVNHLPIIDFRPYSVGTHIPTKMATPKGAPADVYETKLFYKKNGVVKEFTMNNYPWQDTTWKWVKTENALVKKGYVPPIHGFSITSATGEDITSRVLADTSYTFLFISPDISMVKPQVWTKVQDYFRFAAAQNHQFYFLTSTPNDIANKIKKDNKLMIDFYATDQTTLKTIIRSNPGLVLMKDGVVLGMWHYNDFPKPEYFKGNILSKVLTDYHKTIEWKQIFILSLGFVIILLALLMGKGPKSTKR